jgi:hypothetical protein
MAEIPVLVISEAVGVEKSTTAVEAGRLLREADLPHAVVDLPSVSNSWPRREDDPWNEDVAHENLRCLWENFRRRGARRLVLSRVVEAPSVLSRVEDALVDADITLVELRASLDLIEARIRRRDEDASWFIDAARTLVPRLQTLNLTDLVIDCSNRSVREVAGDCLRAAGWL